MSRLHETFEQHGLEDVIVDRRAFGKEIAPLLLDTWMMATQEIATNVLDKLGGGRGDKMRRLIEEVGIHRQDTCFNLDRVITVGKKPF